MADEPDRLARASRQPAADRTLSFAERAAWRAYLCTALREVARSRLAFVSRLCGRLSGTQRTGRDPTLCRARQGTTHL